MQEKFNGCLVARFDGMKFRLGDLSPPTLSLAIACVISCGSANIQESCGNAELTVTMWQDLNRRLG